MKLLGKTFALLCAAMFSTAYAAASDYETSASGNDDAGWVTFTAGNSQLQWDEFYDKERSAGVQGDKLHIESKKDKISVLTVSSLPLRADDDFKVKTVFTVSEINDKTPFGIVFNYKDEDNWEGVTFVENTYSYVVFKDGEEVRSKSKSRPTSIKLKKGKKKTVEVTVEKRGEKLRFSIDGNEEFLTRRPAEEFKYRDFGYVIGGKGWIDVDSVAVYQENGDEDNDD